MASNDDDFGFAPPAFKPGDALLGLKRGLRDLRTLSERGEGFELKGAQVIEFTLVESAIEARLARRPMRGGSTEWDRFTLAGSADVRQFSDEVKKRRARWTEEER